jgi:alpha-L-arabinofuranosidase
MKKDVLKILALGLLTALEPAAMSQQTCDLTLDARKIGAPVQSTMYGLFFEDINFGADGGLYAELVKNRSFDFPQTLMGWNTFGKVEVSNENPPFDKNPHYIVMSNSGHAHKHTGIENEGFRGMGFKEGAEYRFTVWGKKLKGNGSQKIRVELINSKNDIIGRQDLVVDGDSWSKHSVVVTSKATDAHGRLRIFFQGDGAIAVDHVSLFPSETFKGRENGLRKDLAQALVDINPGIFRFPGGCIVEGTDLDTRYNWKKSVGPVENRPVNENRWHYTFPHRFFPDYFQTYGLGFYEYFLLSEDMGAEPLPVVSVGLACQYQNDDMHCHVPVGELDSYIQDALDLIEFANGPVTSEWGKVRADMGHPESFNLKFIGIGNEQWGSEYPERLELFVKAIRAKYPNIKIVGSSGPSADGKQFDYLWPEMKRLKVDLVDEHYYKEPDWFFSNAARYDNYDRKGPAVFAGEYASHDHSTGKQNNFLSALSEAAFMTGLERNADIVHMCTYAPLFAHVDAWQWNPDMIWFDNLRMMKTPNYYIQQIYAQNKGTNVLKLQWTGSKNAVTGQENIYASAVYDLDSKCYIIKVANTSKEAKELKVNLSGVKKGTVLTLGDCISMQNNDLKAINTLDSPANIVPQKTSGKLNGNVFSATLNAQSFNVFKIKF